MFGWWDSLGFRFPFPTTYHSISSVYLFIPFYSFMHSHFLPPTGNHSGVHPFFPKMAIVLHTAVFNLCKR